ncbi:kynureninase [Sulfitobacter mediterraneus]|uniref:kynureninase n=1 Tax=Sulfitobacter mediterraneus TaxID=83219 RepID=UPI0019337EC1|nr:kynureninase [Sulfitobacter mediterraneus]MBM1631706.1 kynureninase [Sulfitobacter mediterraneus]MBM1639521.1 kynureninase [Sulfitobacter mediterraneus]MBM1643570.1 kynureninase [Sulfitobacter mediterraneus]MBM1647616.1 kynureninase [Sulfitobacter mediterraneus]MBM1651661.1 kynureninase [Sulfitobacter mediterraneus]
MADVLRKDQFILPEGVIYLDGNSLGPMPKTVPARVSEVMTGEWAQMLIGGWNKAGWMAMPERVGDQVGALVGASAGSVVMGDTLSVKVFQALASAVKLRPERRVILSDTGNFPSDLYMAEGLVGLLEQGYELRTVAPEEVAEAIGDDIAVVMLTEVDYRSGRMHDMKAMTKLAHAAGAVMVWDLAHSAGAIPVDLAGSGCEFAVGCTYKYLNGGPGAPAFIYVRPDLADTVEPALSGWLGHRQPFDFDLNYTPAKGIERMRVGTPPILQMAALEEAMKVWDGVDMGDLRAASLALQEQFIAEVEAQVPQLELASPRDAKIRGSQVSFRFEHGYAAMQAVIDRGVIGDFRAPDIMRFGFTPLYLDAGDVTAAVGIIRDVMANDLWDDDKYKVRSRVT